MRVVCVFVLWLSVLINPVWARPITEITITPNGELLDVPVALRIAGLTPGQQVTVHARRVVRQDEVYSSKLNYTADANGTIDLSSVPAGKQTTEAPNRLLWSMTMEPGVKQESTRRSDLEPLETTITAEHNGKTIASATLKQLIQGPSVVRKPIRERGLVGTCFSPSKPGKYPAILCFGGSGGGLSETREALLASQGYVVFALAYFNYEQLPKSMAEIPLEYFGTAIDWLQKQENVQQHRMAVLGTSRGGELALLLGTIYPQIKAVIAYVPSHVVWGGNLFQSAWSYQGKPVRFMSKLPDANLVKELMKPDPASNTPAFLLQLANAEEVRLASIPVEKIQGPVLLFSGEDDRLWPSTYMSKRVMERLKEHQHPHASEHYAYPSCGHTFALPMLPPLPNRRVHRVTRQEIAYGGTLEASAFAAWDSWGKLKQFLQTHLKK